MMMLCLAILFFMAIIREESGTHFDPAVVEAFFAVAEEFEKVRETE